MSASLLREAAAKMRRDAENATPGRWKLWGMTVMADQDGTSNVDTAVGVAQTFYRDGDAAHIASWHPAVALAVADLLDHGAEYLEYVEQAHAEEASGDEGQFFLAVARAYLRSDS